MKKKKIMLEYSWIFVGYTFIFLLVMTICVLIESKSAEYFGLFLSIMCFFQTLSEYIKIKNWVKNGKKS